MEEKHHEHQHPEHEHQVHKKKEETITISKAQLWQIASGVLAIALVFSVYTGGFGFGDGTTPAKSVKVQQPSAAAPQPSAAPSLPPAAAEVSLEGAYSLGDDSASVTLIEFSDFQCPFCGRFRSETFDQVKAQYIDTGKVKFYYMDFPLDSIHPNARPAANAARCAGEQGKFWEYHDLLFANQVSLSDANYKKWAADLGLTTKQFNECYDSRKYDAEVSEDLTEGTGAGIRGTPGFLLNGQVISGAQPFQVFQQAIEAALQG